MHNRRSLAPSPVYDGPPREHEVTIQVVDYREDLCEERTFRGGAEDVVRVEGLRRADATTWIHVDGLYDVELVTALGRVYDLHALAVEDIVTLDMRAKAEDYGESVVINLKHITIAQPGVGELGSEHLSIALGPSWVLSFQELPGTLLSEVRTRLREHRGRIRRMGADYLIYALVDAVVDEYRNLADRFEGAVDALEERPTNEFDEHLPEEVHQLKRQILAFRRAVLPVREAVAILQHTRPELVHKHTQPYLRDLQVHVAEVVDLLDSLRDRLQASLDLHLALANHRMNGTMRVLTVVTSVFIPLSFLTSLYGMNFDFMPELHFQGSYPALIGVMVLIAGGQLLHFRRRGWI